MTTKISELPTGQKVGNILDETLNVGGAATTATTPTVTIPRASAATNTVQPVLRLQHTTSGTPANGIGASVDFEVETAAANNEIGASIAAVTTDVTSTSEDFDLRLSTMVAGSTTLVEGARLRGARFTGGAAELDDGYISFFQTKGGAFARTTAERTAILDTGTGRWTGSSGAHYGLSANAAGSDAGLTADVAFARHAANVGKVTNGSTSCRFLMGGGAAVASADPLPAPTGSVFHVTGTTGFTNITTTGLGTGVMFTMIFDDALTVTDGGNLKLAGNFTTTADDTLTVVFDGTNFYEIARSVN